MSPQTPRRAELPNKGALGSAVKNSPVRFPQPPPWLLGLWALLFYLVVTLFNTYPLAAHLTADLAGAPGDNLQFAWNIWWVGWALRHHHNPLITHSVFYPLGVNLAWVALAMVEDLLAQPLVALWGLLPAYNLLVIGSLTLSGWAAYLLAFEVTEAFLPSLVGGLLYGTAPYLYTHTNDGHLNLLAAQWLPLFLLVLYRLLKEPPRRPWVSGLALGSALLLTGWSEENYLLYAILAGTLMAGLMVWGRWERLRATWSALLTGAVLFTLGFLPQLVAAFTSFPRREYVHGWGGANRSVADLLGYITPSGMNPLFGPLTTLGRSHFTGNPGETVVTLGILPLLLVLWTIRKGPNTEARRVFTVLAAVFFLFSLGPTLHVGGLVTGIPLPYLFLHLIPVLNQSRIPARFSLVVQLSAAVLLAMGLLELGRRGRRMARFLPVGMALWVFVQDAAFPMPLTAVTLPPVYPVLAHIPGRFAVLDLPLQWRSGEFDIGQEVAPEMLYQALSGKAYHLPEGYVSRIPFAVARYYQAIPLIRSLQALQEGYRIPRQNMVADRRFLPYLRQFWDLRAVVVHPQVQSPAVSAYLKTVFGQAPRLIGADWVVILPPAPVSAPSSFRARSSLGRLHLLYNWRTLPDDPRLPVVAGPLPTDHINATGHQALIGWRLGRPRNRLLSLTLRPVRFATPRTLILHPEVNGHPLRPLRLLPGWQTVRLAIPAADWQRGMNILRLVPGTWQAVYPATAVASQPAQEPVPPAPPVPPLPHGPFGLPVLQNPHAPAPLLRWMVLRSVTLQSLPPGKE